MRARMSWCVGLAAAVAIPMMALGQCPGGEPGGWSVGPAQRLAGPGGAPGATQVRCAQVFDPDGPGPEPSSLVVGGQFPLAGQAAVNNVASWNGTEWKPMGAGFNGAVNALAVHNGQLYAGGSFTDAGAAPGAPPGLGRVARWNASTGAWEALGAGVTSSGATVSALASYGGRLYAGGQFTAAGGTPANNIASWDGVQWARLGAGGGGAAPGGGGVEFSGTTPFQVGVSTLAVFDGRLIVGGHFNRAAGVSVGPSLARWDGSAWSGFGAFLSSAQAGRVLALRSFSGDTASYLYAGGEFTAIDGTAASNIARYVRGTISDTPWTALGGGLNSAVTSFYVSGAISPTGATAATLAAGIQRLSGGAWTQVAPEAANFVTTYGGTLTAGVDGRLAQRAGSAWAPIGPGLGAMPQAVLPHDGRLWALAGVSWADGQPALGAARWEGASWTPVDGSGGSGINTTIWSMRDWASVPGLMVLTGYGPTGIGPWLTSWNGSAWSTLPTSASSGSATLRILGGDIYLCTSTAVRRWVSPSMITAQVGGSLANPVDVVLWDGALHAATDAGILRFNGTSWGLGPSLRTGVARATRLWVGGGRLLAAVDLAGGGYGVDEMAAPGGAFVPSLAGVRAYDFIDWRGRVVLHAGSALYTRQGAGAWSAAVALTSAGPLYRLAVHDGDLIVSGVLTVNGAASPGFGRLRCCPADYNGQSGIDLLDIFSFLSDWFAGAPKADFNLAGGVELLDIFDFLAAWFAGC